MKLEHIGIAVTDAAAAVASLTRVLQTSVYRTEMVEAESVLTHFISTGNTKIELLEPTDDESALARSIRSRGSGLHHLAFEVEDIHATFDRVRSDGLSPLSDTPYAGADGKLVFFVHPRDTSKVLIEFCQSVRPAGETISIAGTDVIRTGNREAPLALVIGFRPTDAVMRPLEASHNLMFISDDIPLAEHLSAAPGNGRQPFDLIVAAEQLRSRSGEIASLPSTPNTLVVVGDVKTPLDARWKARRTLLVQSETETILETEWESIGELSVSVIPPLPSATQRAELVASVVNVFLSS